MTYRRTSGLPPKTHHFHVLGFVTEARNQNDTMALALLWVWVGKVHSIILVVRALVTNWIFVSHKEGLVLIFFQYWPYMFLHGSLIPLKIQYKGSY
jgi:hypothetical protein